MGNSVWQKELRLASFRTKGRYLFFSALLLIVTITAFGFFVGQLTDPVQLFFFYGITISVIILGCLFPYLNWLASRVVLTNVRVISFSGLFIRRSSELNYLNISGVDRTKSLWQGITGCETIILKSGADETLRLKNVPVKLRLSETLAEQVNLARRADLYRPRVTLS